MQKTKANCGVTKVGTLIYVLQISNYDHGVNNAGFDNYGSLLVTVGSTTNRSSSSKQYHV